MAHKTVLRPLLITVVVLSLLPTLGVAQDLEPRTYVNAPVGLNFLVAGYGYSRGNVLVDQALPIDEGRADLHLFVSSYVRTLDLFGRLAKVKLLIPFTRGKFEGVVNGTAASTSRSNFADPRLDLSIGLFGAPALRGREFAEYRQGTIVGVSLQIIIPLGQYDPSKLVNLGSNRWSFRPQIGVARAVGSFDLELYGSAWIFTDNPQSFGGTTLEQRTIYTLQGHASYTFRPGLWLALNGGYAGGGRTTVGGVPRSDFQENARVGGTLSIPLAPRHSVKLVFSSGIATRIGADFDSFLVAYQLRWGGGP